MDNPTSYRCSKCCVEDVKLWLYDEQTLLCIQCVETHPDHQSDPSTAFVLPGQDWLELDCSLLFEPAIGMDYAPSTKQRWDMMDFGRLQRLCKHTQDIEVLFAELRSLHHSKSIISQSELLWFLNKAYCLNPGLYAEQWLPYLAEMNIPQFYVAYDRCVDILQTLDGLLPTNVEIFYHCIHPRYLVEAPLTDQQLQRITGLRVHHLDAILPSIWSRLPELKTLQICLGRNRTHQRILKDIAQSASMAHLETLTFIDNPVDDDDIDTLVKSKYLKHLKYLHLSDTNISEKGVSMLMKSKMGLTALEVRQSNISWHGKTPRSHNLNKLQKVHLEYITPQDAEKLEVMFEDLDFSYQLANQRRGI